MTVTRSRERRVGGDGREGFGVCLHRVLTFLTETTLAIPGQYFNSINFQNLLLLLIRFLLISLFYAGGLTVRAILQTMDDHNVDSFISLSSPQMGQYGGI